MVVVFLPPHFLVLPFSISRLFFPLPFMEEVDVVGVGEVVQVVEVDGGVGVEF